MTDSMMYQVVLTFPNGGSHSYNDMIWVPAVGDSIYIDDGRYRITERRWYFGKDMQRVEVYLEGGDAKR